MVKIAAKKKIKVSPALVVAVVATIATVLSFSTFRSDDGSLGSLLATDFSNVRANTGDIDSASALSESSQVQAAFNGTSPKAAESKPVVMEPAKADRKEDIKVETRVEPTGQLEAVNYYQPGSTSGLQPVRCDEYFKRGYIQAGQKQAEEPDLNVNNDQIHARLTKNYTNNFWISIHHKAFDGGQYNDYMELGGHYKKVALTDSALKIMASTPGRVLDVGAQVGWFSMLARAVGREVDAFEPVTQNVFRLCESLFLNRWSNFIETAYDGPYVNIHNIALGSEDLEAFSMQQTGASASIVQGGQAISVKMTTLDQFVQGRGWTNEPIALLKVNTMGMEDQLLEGAKSLLTSKMVKNVLLAINGASSVAPNALLQAGYKLNKWGGSNGPDQDSSGVETSSDGWVAKLAAKESGQLFLWFKL